MNTTDTPEQALRRLQVFVVRHALPLWAAAGFDEANGRFHERLEFSGAPLPDVPRRLIVQARQIVVVADSSKMGLVSPAVVCQPKEIDLLITDNGISEEAAAAFAAAGVKVLAV